MYTTGANCKKWSLFQNKTISNLRLSVLRFETIKKQFKFPLPQGLYLLGHPILDTCLKKFIYKALDHFIFLRFFLKTVTGISQLFLRAGLTLLNLNSSSSYTGFIPLLETTLVLFFFLLVSVGKPYMSTSTHVLIFLSDRYWPEMT